MIGSPAAFRCRARARALREPRSACDRGRAPHGLGTLMPRAAQHRMPVPTPLPPPRRMTRAAVAAASTRAPTGRRRTTVTPARGSRVSGGQGASGCWLGQGTRAATRGLARSRAHGRLDQGVGRNQGWSAGCAPRPLGSAATHAGACCNCGRKRGAAAAGRAARTATACPSAACTLELMACSTLTPRPPSACDVHRRQRAVQPAVPPLPGQHHQPGGWQVQRVPSWAAAKRGPHCVRVTRALGSWAGYQG